MTKRRSPHWIKKYLPTSLFGRALLIIMLPIAIMQVLVAWVFFNAHWQTVTSSLSDSVAADIAVAVELYQQAPDQIHLDRLDQLLRPQMKISVVYDDKSTLPTTTRKAFFSNLDKTLGKALTRNLKHKFWFDTTRYPHYIDIRVLVDGKVLKFVVPRERVFAPTGFIFLFWLFMATVLLSLVSIIFIRNQAKPIVELAEAAENFGKGRPLGRFKPSGAREVRQAGQAFLEMQARIARHIDQRTALLAGVSHDLRTPLTRLKLHLAMEEETDETRAARKDIEDMELMLEHYLDFARDSADEERQTCDIGEKLEEMTKECAEQVSLIRKGNLHLECRPSALRRALSNLVGNACAYADNVNIEAKRTGRHIVIAVDDDGPSIPVARRAEALKPFVRLDPARNQNIKGVGLGLSIANDIIQAHGGTLSLEDSPMGGLRCLVILPL